MLRQFERAVDLGTPTDAVRRVLAASGKVGTIVAAEPAAARLDASSLRVAADEEALPFADGSLDLVVSALSLQFVNDLPGTLIQIRRALKADGLLLAALIGGDSLTELREAFAASRKRDRRRRLAACGAVRRCARARRAAATRRLRAAGGRFRPADGALRHRCSR